MLRIHDLPILTDSDPHPTIPGARLLRRNPVLYCPQCTSTYSADRRDYWSAAPTTPIRCAHCAEQHPAKIAPALQLVRMSSRVEVLAR